MAPLHAMNPLRARFTRDAICRCFQCAACPFRKAWMGSGLSARPCCHSLPSKPARGALHLQHARRGQPANRFSLPASRLDPRQAAPLAGLRILDVGCGGGLLSEVINKMICGPARLG
jgi:2-polyprenyl-3-methyl-5-hydroxy-6-metoxy-1,4-benzoquinol methylase